MSKYIINEQFDPTLKLMLSSQEDIAQNVFQFIKKLPAALLDKIEESKQTGNRYQVKMDGLYWEMLYDEKFEAMRFIRKPVEDVYLCTELVLGSINADDVNKMNFTTINNYYVGSFMRVLEYENSYTDGVLEDTNQSIEYYDFELVKKRELFKQPQLQLRLMKESSFETNIDKIQKPIKINPDKIWGNGKIQIVDDPDGHLKLF